MKTKTLLTTTALTLLTTILPTAAITISTQYTLASIVLVTDSCVNLSESGATSYCNYMNAVHGCPCPATPTNNLYLISCSLLQSPVNGVKGILDSDANACSLDAGTFEGTV
ncbi:hypothetical protein BO78DRAFT_430736 [Aspergillus sclerotiicarbonarius CBS 121057]|uniref:Extracellular membrane protein CFEM domain-containing protein n=1 Tax=Aspergillus sclerotiicarbonarius (strain CBS 121057 / IBT 28362) TaxID=1448318 RepID=A0A319EN29_ASPSB|nr:hypothetical protein BO78DRAFT_430736 [Aspergillus sclerotiicarbonarius CBS 121057]